jgi:hypothetical protein
MVGLAKRLVFLAMALTAGTLAPSALAQDKDKDKAQKEAEETLSAIVRVKSKIIKDARSAETLGLQRDGSGVLIRDGYVLTIGYLVIEAESIEVSGPDGNAVPATVAGYDHASGFGLLKLLAPFAGKPLALGDASALEEREAAMIASHGGRDGVNLVYVVSRRPFTGSWEYLLDSAIFTYPAVMNWSGAALISAKGELLGIGSLIVNDSAGAGSQSPGNMFVPIDLLKPILEDLIAAGRRSGPAQAMDRIERRGNARPAHRCARVARRACGARGIEERRHRDRRRRRGSEYAGRPIPQGVGARRGRRRSSAQGAAGPRDSRRSRALDRPSRVFQAEADLLAGVQALSNQPLTDEERKQIEVRILALEVEHHDLDDVIARLVIDPRQDELQLRRLKKRKLLLKDTIARLRDRLIPDIIA